MSSEEREFLESWNPDPLVPEIDTDNYKHLLNPQIVTSKAGKFIKIDGVECLNFGTYNYLGLADHPRLEEASIEAVRKYSVGSCGPRAFYGTMDVHLRLEEELAKFLNVQEVALYAYGFATVASAIPAYAKATDIIFVDEQCNFAIQQGMIMSRSKIVKFKHNNPEDLELKIQEHLYVNGKKKATRTFILIEGIYAKTGQMCPLNELIEVKRAHKIRLFIDESLSFGTIGADGKGVTQFFNVDINEVDLIMASLEGAFCGYGGFCAGSTFVIDHQRLAGAGYCFSASLPPFQTQVALESLNLIRENPQIVKDSQALYIYAQEKLTNLTYLMNISQPLSPIKILVVRSSYEKNKSTYDKDDERMLDKMRMELFIQERIAVSVVRYLEEEEMTSPVASIRLAISGSHGHGDIDRICIALHRLSPA